MLLCIYNILEEVKKMNLKKLDEARQDKGISITKLASEMGINRSTWYRWLSGEMKPSADKLAKLCELLGVDITEVI